MGLVFGSNVGNDSWSFGRDGRRRELLPAEADGEILGAALAIGLAAFGGALGQGKTAAAALDGIARNPAAQGKIFVPMIIGLALIESLVLYAFVIAFLGEVIRRKARAEACKKSNEAGWRA